MSALNVLHAGKENIYPTYISKHKTCYSFKDPNREECNAFWEQQGVNV